MPQVTVYIRDDDLPKWKSIDKKSEFMHNALAGLDILASPGKSRLYAAIATKQTGQGEVKFTPASLNIPGVVKGSEFVPKPPDPETGYPCCVKARPCKHWQWVGEKEAYVNTLTGKEREADL